MTGYADQDPADLEEARRLVDQLRSRVTQLERQVDEQARQLEVLLDRRHRQRAEDVRRKAERAGRRTIRADPLLGADDASEPG